MSQWNKKVFFSEVVLKAKIYKISLKQILFFKTTCLKRKVVLKFVEIEAVKEVVLKKEKLFYTSHIAGESFNFNS